MSTDADPIPALYAEKCRVTDLIDASPEATEDEIDPLFDQWRACNEAALATPATTSAGAIASIEWVRTELLQFGFEANAVDTDRSDRLVLALLDGALGVLRRPAIIEATATVGVSTASADHNRVPA